MPLQYKRIGVTVKSELDEKNTAVETVLRILQDCGAEVLIDPNRCGDLDCIHTYNHFQTEHDIDLLAVIGGDGTILRSIRELSECRVPILSVNKGTVGFLAEVDIAEAKDLIPKLLMGEGTIEKRSLLDVQALRNGEEMFAGRALNEAVMAQGTIARIVDLRATVNGEAVTAYHADGLIVATPTGSTAYSLASGGPIVHPALPAMILTPINPYSFSQKPTVIPGTNTTIEIEVLPKNSKYNDAEVILTLDGQVYHPLKRNDQVRITTSSCSISFLRRKQDTFFRTLRHKLRWGEKPGT